MSAIREQLCTQVKYTRHTSELCPCLFVDGMAVALSRDHKADREDEVKRVREAGGAVTSLQLCHVLKSYRSHSVPGFVIHKRIMGELAISRALGDADFKDTYKLVIATPEIQMVTARPAQMRSVHSSRLPPAQALPPRPVSGSRVRRTVRRSGQQGCLFDDP